MSPIVAAKYTSRKVGDALLRGVGAAALLLLYMSHRNGFLAHIDESFAMKFMVIIAASVVAHSINTSPLKIVQFRDGKFWMSGCSEAFLQAITATTRAGDAGEPSTSQSPGLP